MINILRFISLRVSLYIVYKTYNILRIMYLIYRLDVGDNYIYRELWISKDGKSSISLLLAFPDKSL